MNRWFSQAATTRLLILLSSMIVWSAGNRTAHAQTAISVPACPETEGPCSVSIQNAGPGQIAGRLAVPAGLAPDEEVQVVINRPYQARALTESKQTLADGSHIIQKIEATVARDSQGRTVRIQGLGGLGPLTATGTTSIENAVTFTTIFDPVANIHIEYTSDSNDAHGHALTMRTGPTTVARLDGDSSPGPVTMSVRGGAADATQTGPLPIPPIPPQPAIGQSVKTESLGSRTIGGVQADGTRTTRIIPAGMIGNEKNIVITQETWYSPDLKLVLLSTQNDPRFGQTTYTLSDIKRGEPNAALFQLPTNRRVQSNPIRLEPPQ